MFELRSTRPRVHKNTGVHAVKTQAPLHSSHRPTTVNSMEGEVPQVKRRRLSGSEGGVVVVEPLPSLLVKRHSEKAKVPTRGSAFAAGYDLYRYTPHATLVWGRVFLYLVVRKRRSSLPTARLWWIRRFLSPSPPVPMDVLPLVVVSVRRRVPMSRSIRC